MPSLAILGIAVCLLTLNSQTYYSTLPSACPVIFSFCSSSAFCHIKHAAIAEMFILLRSSQAMRHYIVGDILVLQCYIQVTSVTGRWVFPCLELCFYTSDSQKWLWHCPACVFWKIPASKGKHLFFLTNQYWSRWNICSDPTVQVIQSKLNQQLCLLWNARWHLLSFSSRLRLQYVIRKDHQDTY